MALPPAQVLPFAATSADVQLLTGLFVLRGWSMNETTGSAVATAVLRDGTSTSAPSVASIALASAGAASQWLSGNGVLLRTGLFLDITAGSAAGTIWYNAITHTTDVELVEGDQGPYFMHPGV